MLIEWKGELYILLRAINLHPWEYICAAKYTIIMFRNTRISNSLAVNRSSIGIKYIYTNAICMYVLKLNIWLASYTSGVLDVSIFCQNRPAQFIDKKDHLWIKMTKRTTSGVAAEPQATRGGCRRAAWRQGPAVPSAGSTLLCCDNHNILLYNIVANKLQINYSLTTYVITVIQIFK